MVLKTKLLIIAANLMSFQAQPQQAQLPTFSQPAVVMGSNNLTADQSLIIVNLESSFSHAAAAVALLGVLLNLLFLRTLIKHRATLLQTAHSYIGPGIFVLCTVSVFHGTLIVIESELWISSLWVDNSPLSNRGFSNSLAGLGYCFLTFLFETNFVLALERYWTIKYAEKVPKRVIGQITGVTILVALLFIISFGLAPNSGWFFTPMGLPLSHDYSSLRLTHPSIILFLIACCYFPAIAVACCFVYENTYFNIAAVYEQMHDVHEREGRRRANEAIHLNRKILIRCIVMSIGLFVWYAPNLVCIIITIIQPDFLPSSLSEISFAWLVSLTSLIPALDPVWTPMLILAFQENFGAAFVEDYAFLNVVFRNRTKIDVAPEQKGDNAV